MFLIKFSFLIVVLSIVQDSQAFSIFNLNQVSTNRQGRFLGWLGYLSGKW